MHTNLPADTVDVELIIRMVQEIYIYHKDHTTESTIFTPWSKSVTPFPSLRKKIKAFKEDGKGHLTPTWMPLVNTLTKPPINPRKCTSGKVITGWFNCNHHFNPIKTNQVNTLGTDLMDKNKINIIKCIPPNWSHMLILQTAGSTSFAEAVQLVKQGLGWRQG